MESEAIGARGHRNITAKHRTTLEFTVEKELTLRGDCIIAVSAGKGCLGLGEGFREALRNDGARLEILIECDGISEKVVAYGSSKLMLTHPADAVIRKSDFICPRTLAINADKAACDLGRNLVEKLRSGKPVFLTLNAKV